MTKEMKWYDGDAILKSSLLWVGKRLEYHSDYPLIMAGKELKQMEKECNLRKWFGHRKSPTYKWSNSGSANAHENTLMNRPTWWIQNKILKHCGIDPYKGANFDQLRAYWITLYMRRERWIAIKHLIGFVCRIGFTPSLMEHILFKPQAAIMLFATIWKPLRYLSYPIFMLSRRREFQLPVWDGTTNKISLIPTCFLLGMRYVPKDYEDNEATHQYIREVYTTYFCEEGNKMVGEAMIRGLTKDE